MRAQNQLELTVAPPAATERVNLPVRDIPSIVATQDRLQTKQSGASVTDALTGTHALRLEGLSLDFGGVRALSDVDLEVQPGEIRAIIGPNGAGKSSLINIISGVYRQDKGLVWIGEQAFRHVPADNLAWLGVARTFQNLALFVGLTVFENILMARVAARSSGFLKQLVGWPQARREEADARKRTADIVEFLDLGHVQHRRVGTLAYGVQKRVELARALVARPHLLLLEEPMAGMTPAEKQHMARYVRAARDEFGTAVVLIEHDLGIVMNLSDRVAVLEYGRKIADGTPSEVRASPLVIEAYTGAAHEGETLEGDL